MIQWLNDSIEFSVNKIIRGKAFVLGDNVDTDQIIPAGWLKLSTTDPEERKLYGKYAMSGVPAAQSGLPTGNVPYIKDGTYRSDYTIIIGGKNFGCGSSREHAPLAIAEAGSTCVVAEFYARIFFRNCINGGYLVPFESEKRLCNEIKTGDELIVDIDNGKLTNVTQGNKVYALKPLGDVAPIIEAGGVFDYARQAGMLAK